MRDGEQPTAAQTGSRLQLAALLATLLVPLVIALAVLRRTRWYPTLDLAMTELRVRDVGGRHTPLIGLPGRIGTLAVQGSHPGPASFYALAPTYRLLGSSAWALQTGTVVIHGVALAVALWIARRRGGLPLLLGVALLLAVLTRGYGLSTLTEPWNPYLPLMWWFVFLLAVWSVICGDLPMLPIAVLAGSFCAQTHVPYLAMTLGLGALATAAVVLLCRRQQPDERRRALRWGLAAIALGIVLWTPPVIDQLVHTPGNANLLYHHFTSPPEEPVGLRTGARMLLLHLDLSSFTAGQKGAVGSLVDATSTPTGSVIPGLVTLAVWAAAAVAAKRLGHTALVRLHIVVAAGLALAVISMSRIFGDLWFYLMLWAWGITALLVLSVCWTAAVALGPRLDDHRRGQAVRAATAGLLAVMLVAIVGLADQAADAEPPAPRLSSTLGKVLPDTAAALDRGVGAATGRSGRYLVTWDDALHIGSQGYGLASELERMGFHVGVDSFRRAPMTNQRVLDPAQATATVEFATGIFIQRWQAKPGVVQVAFVDPRTPAERREFAVLRTAVLRALGALKLADVQVHVDDNLFGASIDARVPRDIRKQMARMLDLGVPTAVFVAPPGMQP